MEKADTFKLKDENGKTICDNRGDKGANGMVAAAKYEATKIGIDIIKRGGNAVDAAVAVGFALGVCEPNASGIGGGGFMNIRMGKSGELVFLDFREVAPEEARPSMWELNEEGKVANNEKSEGGKAVGVPGEVAGLVYACENYGTMPIEELMKPAISLAEEGVDVSDALDIDIKTCSIKLEKFEENGNAFTKYDDTSRHIKNPALAKTLRKIAKEGIDGFYKGEIAEKLVKSVVNHGGSMKISDLENYSVNKIEPVVGTYRGYTVISSPLPSSGGTHVLQILNILENFDMSSFEVNSVEYIHLMSEVFKMCFADRAKYMGDPSFVKVPVAGLTSKKYAKKLADKIELMSKSHEYDHPFDYEPKDTTHYSIADRDGNMVSVTKSISAFFGSGVIPEDTGIMLNCQMRCFSHIEGNANTVGSGKKPLSSMSPTIILKDNKPFAVVGSPGGNRIITAVAQVISKLIDHDMTIQDAINSPRITDESNEIIMYEGRISEEVIEALEIRGHKTQEFSNYDRKFGGVQGIRYLEDGTIEGAGDPRRDGVAIGY
jgi:gamma-glutamyltranspeptidase/glutathione hydrolase